MPLPYSYGIMLKAVADFHALLEQCRYLLLSLLQVPKPANEETEDIRVHLLPLEGLEAALTAMPQRLPIEGLFAFAQGVAVGMSAARTGWK